MEIASHGLDILRQLKINNIVDWLLGHVKWVHLMGTDKGNIPYCDKDAY